MTLCMKRYADKALVHLHVGSVCINICIMSMAVLVRIF
jgi:hypothetical protein